MPVQHPIHVDGSCPFTLENIPFGIFSTKQDPNPRPATIIGDLILDLKFIESQGLLGVIPVTENTFSFDPLFSQSSLNAFASQDRQTRLVVRERIIELLSDSKSPLYSDEVGKDAFIPVSDAVMHLPMHIGGFTDFLTSRIHAENCAKMAGQNLHESFDHFPTAYNGRASSIVVSGTPIRRPNGMIRTSGASPYSFSPCARLDFELEMGIFISEPIPYGTVVTADEAANHIFGLVLLNDWSARDIQWAEMVPLGPFQGKAFATSISPWVVTPEALMQLQTMTSSGHAQKNQSTFATHLQQKSDTSTWDIDLEVSFVPSAGDSSTLLCKSNLKHGYWSPAQMIAHHASGGCGLATGDLIGTGTLSGPGHTKEMPNLGCLHELTIGGTQPIELSGQQQQNELTWLSDGDEVVFNGWAGGTDGRKQKIGFGELTGKIVTGTLP